MLMWWEVSPATSIAHTDASEAMGPRLRGDDSETRQNVGNGFTHLLRLPAIRATLGSPAGLIKIQL
jgi:hypothetical protein